MYSVIKLMQEIKEYKGILIKNTKAETEK